MKALVRLRLLGGLVALVSLVVVVLIVTHPAAHSTSPGGQPAALAQPPLPVSPRPADKVFQFTTAAGKVRTFRIMSKSLADFRHVGGRDGKSVSVIVAMGDGLWLRLSLPYETFSDQALVEAVAHELELRLD